MIRKQLIHGLNFYHTLVPCQIGEQDDLYGYVQFHCVHGVRIQHVSIANCFQKLDEKELKIPL